MSKTIPAITTAQMIEIDRLMIAFFGIELLQMMENAGRNLAALARDQFLGGQPTAKRVLVLVGSGGNGGGGMVAARRLHNWGANLQVITTKLLGDIHGVPAHQLNILQRLGIPITYPCIQATATMTLALPKIGLMKKTNDQIVGDLYLADISVPPELFAQMGLAVAPFFAEADIISLK